MSERRQFGAQTGVLWIGLLLLVAGQAAGADELLPGQAGLPPELCIPREPPVQEQRTLLERLAAAKAERRGEFFAGLRQLFSGKGKTPRVWAPAVIERLDELKTHQIEVHGVLRVRDGKLVMPTDGGTILVELAGGVEPEGLKEEELDWAPVAVKGIAEAPFDQPVLHAVALRPSPLMARLRLARLLEVEGQWEPAVKAYQEALTEMQRAGMPWAAFCATEAGWIAYNKLRDAKLARKLFTLAWRPYAARDRQGKPLFYTWWPKADGTGYEKVAVADAIGELLDHLNRESFWYRLLDFFVTICGGRPALGVILLALVTRLALHPLTAKQFASMEALRRLQPEIKALQERYKDDKQKFQQELWKLWQRHGVNPFGGCWPLLIQMPILIFVYQGIRGYIVRFAESGFLWIKDLSEPDLPLLVAYTASMVLFQQIANRMQPAPADEQQRQQQQMMTWMMPLMFFFFFRTLPSAFILYWLASNLIYFGEQWLLRKQAEKAAAEGRPIGGGRSRLLELLAKAAERSLEGEAEGGRGDAKGKGGESGKKDEGKPKGK